jgi:BatD DUF11 like domain
MQLFKNLILVIWLSNEMLSVFAQEKKQPGADINSIFADLPVDNVQRNSVLKKNENAGEKINRNIIVKASTNRNSVYFGEPIMATYELYTALESRSLVSVKPSVTGSGAEELAISEYMPRKVILNGRNFQVFTILKLKLNPYQTGDIRVEPILVDNTVNYLAKDGKKNSYSGTIKSNPLHLVVIPLPEKNNPPDFYGMVGKFEIRNAIEKSDFPTGENNNLHIEISGTGEFENITQPAVSWPAGFDHFVARETLTGDKNIFPFSGKKTFEIPFVSNRQGQFTLPSIHFSYFDPAAKKYRTVATEAIPVKVGPAIVRPPANQPVSGVVHRKIPGMRLILWIIFGLVVLVTAAAILVFKRKNDLRKAQEQKIAEEMKRLAAEQEVKPTDYSKEWSGIVLLSDDTHFLESAKSLLTKLMQEKFSTNQVSEEGILGHLNQVAGSSGIVQHTNAVYSGCNRLLYSPGDQQNLRFSITESMARIFNLLDIPGQTETINYISDTTAI